MSRSPSTGSNEPCLPEARPAKRSRAAALPTALRAQGFNKQPPRGLAIRQRIRTLQLYGPAAAAALISFVVAGFSTASAAEALLLGALIAGTAGLLRDFPYPLRLIPASQVMLAMLPPIAAIVAAGLLALAGEAPGSGVIVGIAIAALYAIVLQVGGAVAMTRRPTRIAVLGSAEFASAIQRELDAIGGRREFEMLGLLNPFGGYVSQGHDQQLWALKSVRAAVVEHEIDLLVRGPGSSASRSGRDVYDKLAEGCLDLPVRMIDGNQLYEQLFGHVPIGTIDSAWFLFLMHPKFQGTSKGSKRVFDLVGGAVAALVSLPLVGLGALAIKLDDGGPVFYRQRRVGEGGREFEILKLRTMRKDAQAAGARWAGAADERITGVGRVLRRLHIDELPQVINVLRGDMTLVGPRPEQPQITAELESLFPHYSRRMVVKPGVTGWAQVRCGYAGSELGTAWKLCHDLYYLKHRSMLSDVLIMLETLVIAARDSHRPLRAPELEFLYRPDGAPRGGSQDRRAPNLTPGPGFDPGQPEIALSDGSASSTALA